MMEKRSFVVVILAAGKGTRMKSNKLKVMHEIKNRPLIDFVIEQIEKLNLNIKPTLVVTNDDDAVQKYLGDRADYVEQKEKLGTGHAVQMAEEFLKNKAENILVLYGDMPFVDAESLKKLILKHLEEKNILTLATVKLNNFDSWQEQFRDFGRIVRNVYGDFVKIIEKKDASEDELNIKEVNPAIFCFQAEWLWKNLKNLKNNNAQKEYYLTDLASMAVLQKQKISTSDISSKEAVGINTREQLFYAEELDKTNDKKV
jgi:bifunctional UDP-N-acetylglucosamine pyrophosphorylase/glucosamine-1-phosphate N-acetyltransferase